MGKSSLKSCVLEMYIFLAIFTVHSNKWTNAQHSLFFPYVVFYYRIHKFIYPLNKTSPKYLQNQIMFHAFILYERYWPNKGILSNICETVYHESVQCDSNVSNWFAPK